MALIGTMRHLRCAFTLRLLLALFASSGLGSTACNDLDPVKVESKCEGTAMIDGNCPQCQTPRIASNCPQCQQSAPDESVCLPADVPWTTETSQADISTLPDGGIAENEGGQASPDGTGAPGSENNPGNSNNDPSNPSKPGSSNARPGGSGSGGSSGASDSQNTPAASAGHMAPNMGPTGCISDDNCQKPGFPACRGDGTCLECIENSHCPNGQQCNPPTNRCVECVNDDACSAQGKVCFQDGRVCVQCTDDSNCSGETPACTLNHECVGCVNDGHCPSDKPSCSSNTCVECSADPDCTRNGTHACIKDEHRCVECTMESHCRGVSGRPHCDLDSNACVACLADPDCSDPSAAHCAADSHSCVPCSSTTHCAAFAGTAPRCDEGECVACDRDGGICNGKACILSTHVCSDKARQSVGACSECESSDECIAGHVCVATMFGTRATGNRCLPNYGDYKQAGKPCPRPYSRKLTKVDTVEAIRVDTLCALPDTTSCQALLDTLSSKECGGNNLQCGLGQYDGYCGMDGCTYNCTSSDYCPNAMSCSDAMRICL